jgi:hypothetical protein
LAVEGVHTSVITHTAASADTAYNGIAIGNVVANVLDNDFASPPQIVITEIMYNPASDESEPGIAEWIEIVNAGSSAMDLSGWMFDDEDTSNWGPIPLGTVKPGAGRRVFDASLPRRRFRAEWFEPRAPRGWFWLSSNNPIRLFNPAR